MKTARVVVIDEDRDEALLLLEALGKAGLGAIYIRGDDEAQIPERPCTGIRLVFLDLKLINVQEPKNYIPFTAQVLSKAVQVDPGVTGIICWTKHEQDIEALKAALKEKGLAPAFVHSIADKLGICQARDIPRIQTEIEQITAQMPARNLLTNWEQLVHMATSSVTEKLWQLAGKDEELLKLLATIAVGAADEKITTQHEALLALYSGLSGVQADAIENADPGDTADASFVKKLYETVGQIRGQKLSPEQRARLNRAILTSTAGRPQPGNLYVAKGWQPQDKFLEGLDASGIKQLLWEYFPNKNQNYIDSLAESCVPCLVELTPACDFAQGKCSSARMLTGLLIKSPGTDKGETDRSLPADSRMFAKEIEFTWFENADCGISGSFKIILNARRLITMAFQELTKHKPVCRLRHSVVADIRAWLGAHAARPGYVAVH